MNYRRHTVLFAALCAVALVAAGTTRTARADEYGQLVTLLMRVPITSKMKARAELRTHLDIGIQSVAPSASEMSVIHRRRAAYLRLSSQQQADVVIQDVTELLDGYQHAVSIIYGNSDFYRIPGTHMPPWFDGVATAGLMDAHGGYWFPVEIARISLTDIRVLTESASVCAAIQRAAAADVMVSPYDCVPDVLRPGTFVIRAGLSVDESWERMQRELARRDEQLEAQWQVERAPLSKSQCQQDATAAATDMTAALDSPAFEQHDVLDQCWGELRKQFAAKKLRMPSIPRLAPMKGIGWAGMPPSLGPPPPGFP